MKLDLSAAEREYLEFLRALGVDSQGHEILVGLTLDETNWYLLQQTLWLVGKDSNDTSDHERFFTLTEKHERARFAVIGAETELRLNSPTIQ